MAAFKVSKIRFCLLIMHMLVDVFVSAGGYRGQKRALDP